MYTAEQLKPLFEPYGSILEVVIIKDKATGQSKGCAFVVFSTKAEADAAIQSLHMKITLPGLYAYEICIHEVLEVLRT